MMHDDTSPEQIEVEEQNTYSGQIVDIKNGHGFIKPAFLPPEFNQRKDVFFPFSKVCGPKLEKGMSVTFRLNPTNVIKPEAEEVYISTLTSSDLAKARIEKAKWKENRAKGDADGRSKRSRSRSQAREAKRKLSGDRVSHNEKPLINEQADQSLNKNGEVKKKSMQVQGSLYQHIGTVCSVKAEFGFLKPTSPLPEDYAQDKDVIFYFNRLRVASLPIKNGDQFEFSLGTKNKDKPMALHAKLIKCVPRDNEMVSAFLYSTTQLLSNDPQKQASLIENDTEGDVVAKHGLILELLNCGAIAEGLGMCKDMTDATVLQILNLFLRLHEKSSGFYEQFSAFLSRIADTRLIQGNENRLLQFVTKWSRRPDSDYIRQVKEFLGMLVQTLPQKAGVVVRLIKPLVSENTDTIEWFLYNTLRHTARTTAEEVSDMDWNELPLVPSSKELLLTGPLEDSVNLSAVRTKGPYSSVHEYMDTYFRLLRADCFDAMRTGIDNLIKGKLDPRDMSVYQKVSLVGILPCNSEAGIQLALKVIPCHPVTNWSTSSNLMFGNLLCLTPSGTFKDAIWATVANREEKLLKDKQGPVIVVELCSDSNSKSDADCLTALTKASGSILMVESPTYYRAYQPVLKALQKIQPEDMPFEEELVQVNQTAFWPSYINDSSRVDGSIIYKSLPNDCTMDQFLSHDALPRRTLQGTSVDIDTALDSSQQEAVKLALSQSVAVIQGPPGTGKTFIGIQLVKLLQSITTIPSKPILVLTYKNHALDEFLKEMVRLYPSGVIRVGGRSNEPALEGCNLNELRKQHKSVSLSKQIGELLGQQRHMQQQLETALQKLAAARTFSIDSVIRGFDEGKLEALLRDCNWSLAKMKKAQNKFVDKSYVCSFLQKHKNQLRGILQGEIGDDDVIKEARLLLQTATKQWSPHMTIFNQIDKVATKLFQPTQLAATLAETASNASKKLTERYKKKGKPNEEENAEHDIEDEQRERMAAVLGAKGRHSKMQDIVWISHRNAADTPQLLQSSSEILKDTPASLWEILESPWDLDEYDKAKLIQYLLLQQVQEAEDEVKNILGQYQSLCRSKEELEDLHKVECISKKKIIGMTITGASICQRLLAMVKPAIVIVEEAAEVLEPQLMAALGKWVQHLILIGDHRQLPPPVESYTLARQYHFDVSLMERLINNEYTYASLTKQNRMRPEFANLLLDIYPHLESNLARVSKNESPKCMKESMYFWEHDDKEQSERSYTNPGEAQRVVQLALFLIQQGYSSDEITILAAYLGQTRLIRRLMRDAQTKYPELFGKEQKPPNQGQQKQSQAVKGSDEENTKSQLKIHTIDLYQGDENEIVIVSLVRSNDKGVCGFLKKLNRRCVSQSRAKCGLYFVGSRHTLQHVDHWNLMISKMAIQGCVGPTITVCCPDHPTSTIVRVSTAEQMPLGSFCHEVCTKPMPCKKHACPRKCKPPHSHVTCQVEIPFIFQSCSHPGTRKCYQNQADMRCQKIIQFTYQACQHLGLRRCTQSEHEIPCKETCSKRLSCPGRHPCPGKCSEPCDAKNCPECIKIRKAEEERRRKEEEKVRQQVKKETQQKIEEIKKRDSVFQRIQLHQHGDTKSEYLDIRDLVMKYVQAGHNWYPEVVKIEKVINSKLEQRWLECKLKRYDHRTALKFHGTSTDAVNAIVKDGFRIGSAGMFGAGIYFATDSSKSAQKMYTKGSDQLLVCDVILGKTKEVQTAANDMTLQKLKGMGYDSLFASRGTRGTGGVLYDEFVVYDKDQALPRYIVHYRQVGFHVDVTSGYNLERNALKYSQPTVHHLVPKREISADDPLDHHFRIAESQFSRMSQHQSHVVSVDYHINPMLLALFSSKIDQFKARRVDNKFIYGFHGTNQGNIDAIMRNNFDMSKITTAAYGRGIYFSEFPDVSIGYARGCKKLLLCRILPGRSHDGGTGSMGAIPPGYDSIRVNKDHLGRGWAIVIDQADQILPCYVITHS